MDPVTLIFAAAALALWISALITIKGSTYGNATALTLWVLIVLIIPIVGAICWFAVGRQLVSTRQ